MSSDRANSVARRLWWASALSSGSTWTMQVGLFLFVLRDHPVSTLAMVELLGTVPALVAMPLAGTLADRHDPRRLALGSMVTQALLLGLMGALLFRELLWVLVVVYAGQGISNTVWPPARQLWLYRALDRDRWPGANAAIGSVSGLTTVLGGGLGGVLSARSPLDALIVSALLQVLAAVTVALSATGPLPAGERPSRVGSPPGPRPGVRRQVVDGMRAVRDLRLARSVVWIGMAWGCIGGAYSVLLAGHVTKDLHGDGVLLGVLYVTDGIAVIVGTFLAARVAIRRHLIAYALAYVAQGACWAAVFLSRITVAVVVALAFMRVASGVIISLDTTVLLATVPAQLRGRVTSLHMTTYTATARLSLAVYGVLLGLTGVQLLGVISGGASVAIGLTWWLRRGSAAQREFLAASLRPVAS